MRVDSFSSKQLHGGRKGREVSNKEEGRREELGRKEKKKEEGKYDVQA